MIKKTNSLNDKKNNQRESDLVINNIYTEEYQPEPKFRIIFSLFLFFFASQLLLLLSSQ